MPKAIRVVSPRGAGGRGSEAVQAGEVVACLGRGGGELTERYIGLGRNCPSYTLQGVCNRRRGVALVPITIRYARFATS
jgi:hypothetical protein